jgi:hypothetical protein
MVQVVSEKEYEEKAMAYICASVTSELLAGVPPELASDSELHLPGLLH